MDSEVPIGKGGFLTNFKVLRQETRFVSLARQFVRIRSEAHV